jgi:hypothetical protein
LKGTGQAPISAEEREELERLRRDHARLNEILKKRDSPVGAKKHDHSENDSDDSSEVEFTSYILIVRTRKKMLLKIWLLT